MWLEFPRVWFHGGPGGTLHESGPLCCSNKCRWPGGPSWGWGQLVGCLVNSPWTSHLPKNPVKEEL